MHEHEYKAETLKQKPKKKKEEQQTYQEKKQTNDKNVALTEKKIRLTLIS